MVDSSSTYSDSDAKKLLSALMIMQAEEERKVFSLSNAKKVQEKLVSRDNKRKNQAESGNPTKRMSNGNNASASSTVEPHTNVNVKFSVSEQAKKLEQTLSQQSPCFVKLLQTSDMHAGKFLDMPENFGDKFFPRPEGSPIVVDFVLVDEDDREYNMSYSFRTRRFRGKWREFSLKHKLASGDALVFNQTGNCKIKVYSLKGNASTEDAQANGKSSTLDILDNPYDTGNTRIVKTVKPLDVELPLIDFQAETATPRSNSNSSNTFFQKERLNLDNEYAGTTRINKMVKPLDVEHPPIDVQSETATPRSNSNSTPLRDLSDHSSNIIGSDINVSLNMNISSSVPNFMEVKSFEDFEICANGEVLDTKIPRQDRMIYYELCNSQKMFLHEHVKGFRSDLVRMIQQTIIIAEATKSANISTSLHDLENMERDLKSLEDSGMAVGFLRKRIHKLVKLLSKHQLITESKNSKSGQIEDERTAMMEEVSMLEKLTKSITTRRSSLGYFEAEFDALKKESEKIEFMIKDVVDSAW